MKYSHSEKVPIISVQQVQDESSPNYITIEFRDKGLQNSDIEIQNIFLPFQTGFQNREDSGLGLSIVTKVMTSMNGKVWAKRPEDQQGLCLYLQLPRGDQIEN